MTDWDKLNSLIANSTAASQRHVVDEAKLLAHLQSRVKGQDEILKDVARVIRLSWMKDKRSRPVCNFLFLGPTGTGKTELAKAICEYLFGDEKALLRFDCSELSNAEMGKARLTGSSAGFAGAEQGGQLTRPMFANPKRVILFDEIEKAHPVVFDLLLQLMGEGRLTEQGSGKTADYTQSVVVMTSNALAEPIAKAVAGLTEYSQIVNAVKTLLAEEGTFRPEILGRVDKVYLFHPLGPTHVAEVALLKMGKLGQEYGIEVRFVAPELIIQALEANMKVSKFGIRELERILFDRFAALFVDARDQKARAVSFQVNEQGEILCRQFTGPKSIRSFRALYCGCRGGHHGRSEKHSDRAPDRARRRSSSGGRFESRASKAPGLERVGNPRHDRRRERRRRPRRALDERRSRPVRAGGRSAARDAGPERSLARFPVAAGARGGSSFAANGPVRFSCGRRAGLGAGRDGRRGSAGAPASRVGGGLRRAEVVLADRTAPAHQRLGSGPVAAGDANPSPGRLVPERSGRPELSISDHRRRRAGIGALFLGCAWGPGLGAGPWRVSASLPPGRRRRGPS
jgi:ATP-dependent Clp protease ATP-binding subunit ClpC